ncbi:MAG: hypothetical protein LKG21_03050 [Ruminococcus sp.]|nr:hypothetical protein [Ruminococcus sp.]
MICPKCGAENKTKFKFCVVCGSNLEDPSKVNIEQIDRGGYKSEEDYASSNQNFTIGSGTFTISDNAPTTASNMFTADELNESIYDEPDEPFIPTLDPDKLSVPQQGLQNSQRQFNSQLQGQPATQQNMAINPQQMYAQSPMFRNPYMPQGQINPQPMQPNMPQGQINPQPMQPNMPQGQINPQSMQPNMPQGQINPQSMQPNMPQGQINSQPMQPNMPQGQINPQQMPYMQPPIYGQPMMQPQFIGYDYNGMPVYAQQPIMQPQLIGYDYNGMPVYGIPQMMNIYQQPSAEQPNATPNPAGVTPVQPVQPQMYGQPQFVQNPQFVQPVPVQGGAVGGAVNMQNTAQNFQGIAASPMPNAMGMPQPIAQTPAAQPLNPNPQTVKQTPQNPLPATPETASAQGDASKAKDDDDDNDFFSKPKSRNHDMNEVSASNLDVSALEKHQEKKANKYMKAAPQADANELAPNMASELNKKYMNATDVVDASKLQENVTEKSKVKMKVTDQENADELEQFVKKAPNVIMSKSDSANPEELETYEHEHVEAIMGTADHAVEALPKKKVYIDEIDAIELPEHMQAKKKVKNDPPVIPTLPEL